MMLLFGKNYVDRNSDLLVSCLIHIYFFCTTDAELKRVESCFLQQLSVLSVISSLVYKDCKGFYIKTELIKLRKSLYFINISITIFTETYYFYKGLGRSGYMRGFQKRTGLDVGPTGRYSRRRIKYGIIRVLGRKKQDRKGDIPGEG